MRLQPPPPVNPSKSLLQASDFTFQGFYNVDLSVYQGVTFQNALTHRYVSGQLRFLLLNFNGSGTDVVEIAPATSLGGTITAATNAWPSSAAWPSVTNASWLQGIHYEDLGGGTGRLWMGQGQVYPGTFSGLNFDSMTSAVSNCTLNSNGTVSNWNGYWGFQGVSQRCVCWKVAPVPSWMQTTYGLGPYLYGFGGGASLASTGGTISTGSFAISSIDVSDGTYAPLPSSGWTPTTLDGTGADWTIPTSAFKIVADHRSGTTNASDWYVSPGNTSAFDRGVRLTNPLNYLETFPQPPISSEGTNEVFDVSTTANVSGTAVTNTGDNGTAVTRFQPWWSGYSGTVNGVTVNAGPFQVTINGTAHTVASITNNDALILATSAGTQTGVSLVGPSSRPTIPPVDGSYWVSPAPDGHGRWTLYDGYMGSGSFVDGASKYGFVAVGSFLNGEAWYANSTVNCDSSAAEIHVFDPADFGAAAAATKNSWNVQPAAMKDVTSDFVSSVGGCVGSRSLSGAGSPGAATFDQTTKLLWIWAPQINNGYNCALMCYSVNC